MKSFKVEKIEKIKEKGGGSNTVCDGKRKYIIIIILLCNYIQDNTVYHIIQ